MRTLILTLALIAFQSATPNLDRVEIQTIPVQGNVHLLVGAGVNSAVQVGPEGVLLVDTQYEQLAPKVVAAIRKLSDKPMIWMINSQFDG